MEHPGILYYIFEILGELLGYTFLFLFGSWWIYFILKKAIEHGTRDGRESLDDKEFSELIDKYKEE